jgi:hypothetical protein
MSPLILLIAVIGNDYAIAAKHREAHFAVEDYGYIYYLTLNSSPGDLNAWQTALPFATASSSKQQIIEFCTPQQIDKTLYMIDLREMEWDWKQFHQVLKTYPYLRDKDKWLPLVIRGDWLVLNLLDTTINDAHYRLLYNNEKLTLKDFYKFWDAQQDASKWYGIPEPDSGVSRAKKRWVINVGTSNRTYLWSTADYVKITKETDPIGNPTYPFEIMPKKPNHDGDEHIAGMPKFSLKKQLFGSLQAYLLTNGKGNQRVEEAPGTLVKGDGSFRGYTSITTFGGCLNCHKEGLRVTSGNDLVRHLTPKDGNAPPIVAAYQKEKSIEITKFNLHSPLFDFQTNNQLYTSGCELVTGHSPKKMTSLILQAIKSYDEDVTTEQAAKEIGTSVEELIFAMAYYNATYPQDFLTPRFTDLTNLEPIPRTTWEEIYTQVYKAYLIWEKSLNK